MGKLVIIVVIGMIIVFGVLNINTNDKVNEGSERAIDYVSENQARNIANSMAEMLVSTISNDNGYVTNSTMSKNFFGGKAEYSVVDISGNEKRILVKGIYNGVSKEIDANLRPSKFSKYAYTSVEETGIH